MNQKPNFLFRLVIRDLGKCEYSYWAGRTENRFLPWCLICQDRMSEGWCPVRHKRSSLATVLTWGQLLGRVLQQLSPAFLAPGTSAMEDNFPMDWGRKNVYMRTTRIQWATLQSFVFIIIHHLHSDKSGIRSGHRTSIIWNQQSLLAEDARRRGVCHSKYICLHSNIKGIPSYLQGSRLQKKQYNQQLS